MATNFIHDDWDLIKEKVQQTWTSFTDDEFDEVRGNRSNLSYALQRKYGLTPNETERKLDEILTLETDTDGHDTQNANREMRRFGDERSIV
jgi:hypothetical protein